MIQGVLTSAGVQDPESWKPIHIVVTSAVFIFPVCLLHDVNSLRYLTLVSIGAILYTALTPRSGAEPWQEMPVVSTSSSMRPRWPR